MKPSNRSFAPVLFQRYQTAAANAARIARQGDPVARSQAAAIEKATRAAYLACINSSN